MQLRTWRKQQDMSVERLAELLGNRTPRTVLRLENGENGADADMVARIEVLSDGAVTAQDMHETRLAWLRANRPERFKDARPQPEAAE